MVSGLDRRPAGKCGPRRDRMPRPWSCVTGRQIVQSVVRADDLLRPTPRTGLAELVFGPVREAAASVLKTHTSRWACTTRRSPDYFETATTPFVSVFVRRLGARGPTALTLDRQRPQFQMEQRARGAGGNCPNPSSGSQHKRLRPVGPTSRQAATASRLCAHRRRSVGTCLKSRAFLVWSASECTKAVAAIKASGIRKRGS
jgi:hypothetical protein